jgi:hypothetical protein
MRVLLATAALFALTAPPAALAKGSVTIGSGTLAALRSAPAQPVPAHLTSAQLAPRKKDSLHSCQAGDRRSHVRTNASPVGETERKAAVVACEQPPRSGLNLSGGMKGAEASALIAAG